MDNKKKARIVLDLSGGDWGYGPNLEALSLISGEEEIEFELICVGEPVPWQERPSIELVRSGNRDPVRVGLELVRDGYADAFVSVGDTGNIVGNAAFILGKLENISRPALLASIPTIHKTPALLIDVGATPRATTQNLVDFAFMALIYAKNVLKWQEPKVSVLSIGEEDYKGTKETKEANSILRELMPNFTGNAEGNDIIRGESRIFVCDGYTGNIILKFAESTKNFFKFAIKKASLKNARAKFGGFLLEPYLKEFFDAFDYARYGGAPLLGINGVCIVGHGRSSPVAIKNAVIQAKRIVQSNILEQIRELSW